MTKLTQDISGFTHILYFSSHVLALSGRGERDPLQGRVVCGEVLGRQALDQVLGGIHVAATIWTHVRRRLPGMVHQRAHRYTANVHVYSQAVVLIIPLGGW
jgi:hypothetical protein